METSYRKPRKRGRYVKKIVDDYCVVDIETTGLSWQRDQIIEIGIVKVRQGHIFDQYVQLIDPHKDISHFITQLTGIDNDMVLECLNYVILLMKFWTLLEMILSLVIIQLLI